MIQSICISERAQESRKRLSTLQEEWADLYEKREHMLTYESAELLAIYTMNIGKYQYEEFATKIAIQKAKRTVELVRAKRNRGEMVDMDDINRQVDNEFVRYQEQLQAKLEQIKQAHDLLSAPVLCDEDSAEMKSLYRVLVKRLHPDWNPDQTDAEKELFLRAKAAYKMCDLQELRNILMMLDKPTSLDGLGIDELDAQICMLEQSIRDIQLRIDQLNETFPFTYRERLQDFAWVKAEQEQIQARIIALKAEQKIWEMALVSIVNN